MQCDQRYQTNEAHVPIVCAGDIACYLTGSLRAEMNVAGLCLTARNLLRETCHGCSNFGNIAGCFER